MQYYFSFISTSYDFNIIVALNGRKHTLHSTHYTAHTTQHLTSTQHSTHYTAHTTLHLTSRSSTRLSSCAARAALTAHVPCSSCERGVTAALPPTQLRPHAPSMLTRAGLSCSCSAIWTTVQSNVDNSLK